MNKKQLAALYQVCRRTITRWLAKQAARVGPPAGNIYTPSQVKDIIDCLGPPPDPKEKNQVRDVIRTPDKSC